MVLKQKNLKNILFLDIETVSEAPVFDELRSQMQEMWKVKSRRLDREEGLSDEEHYAKSYVDKAGIFAEFAKVVCITVGYLSNKKNEEPSLKIKTFAYHDEAELLTEFCELLDRHFDDPDHQFLCGHNIKEFDVPFLCRRLVINGMHLPKMVNIAGRKPWQVAHLLDTMELWRFGDYKNYTSLALLAATLRIPSPKDDIDGSQVGQVYWEEDDLARIVTYCEKDVITVAQIAMRFADVELIEDGRVEIVHPHVPTRADLAKKVKK